MVLPNLDVAELCAFAISRLVPIDMGHLGTLLDDVVDGNRGGATARVVRPDVAARDMQSGEVETGRRTQD